MKKKTLRASLFGADHLYSSISHVWGTHLTRMKLSTLTYQMDFLDCWSSLAPRLLSMYKYCLNLWTAQRGVACPVSWDKTAASKKLAEEVVTHLGNISGNPRAWDSLALFILIGIYHQNITCDITGSQPFCPVRNCWGWSAIWTGRSHCCSWEAAGGRWGSSWLHSNSLQWPACTVDMNILLVSRRFGLLLSRRPHFPGPTLLSIKQSQFRISVPEGTGVALCEAVSTPHEFGYLEKQVSAWHSHPHRYFNAHFENFSQSPDGNSFARWNIETWSLGVEVSHTTGTLHVNRKVSCKKQCFLSFFWCVLGVEWGWRRDIHNKGMTQKLDPGKCDCISPSLGLTA